MKISREHVEAIADLDKKISFPWGRLASEMLMDSIKERDEISLSQNSIVVKGFVLALQLVMVEAVPCLTEVVQEMCSSPEGDSEEEIDDIRDNPKRQTLSPGHARNVDKKSDVIVKSIIDQDPLRPVDETNLVWSDEEEDKKVDNLIYLINKNYEFNNSMFGGRVTKLDVDRMRETEKVTLKAKKLKNLAVLTPSTDPRYIASSVIEKIKPEVHRMDGNIKKACTRVDSMEVSVVGLVESVLAKFKEDMLESVRCLVSEFTKDDGAAPLRIAADGKHTATRETGHVPFSTSCPLTEANNETIRNILGNISSYSTPPQSPRLSQAENPTPCNHKEGFFDEDRVDDVYESLATSGHRQTHHRPIDINLPLVDNRLWGPLSEMPSFSLGLTQEE